MIILVFIAAILPAAVMLNYIYKADKAKPEPTMQLVKAVFFGYLAIDSLLLIYKLLPFDYFSSGAASETPTTLIGCIVKAFVEAAIPEEAVKLLMLWWFVKESKYFDEHVDGIVYAVCIGMGFAATENLYYLLAYNADWVSVAISRAFLAIPGHFCFAVLMGYYFSEIYFGRAKTLWEKSKVLVYPILAHGIYDTIAFASALTPWLSIVLSCILLFFCSKLYDYCKKLIQKQLRNDRRIGN